MTESLSKLNSMPLDQAAANAAAALCPCPRTMTWISLAVGSVALVSSFVIPFALYYYSNTVGGVMAEKNMQDVSGATMFKNATAAGGGLNKLFGTVAGAVAGNVAGNVAAKIKAEKNNFQNITGDALKNTEKMAPTSQGQGSLEISALTAPTNISSIQADALNNVTNTTNSQKDLLQNSLNNATYSIPGLTKKGGGRKTKNNRQKTVQPKIKKPRTKKCLITKGDKMFMSFCI